MGELEPLQPVPAEAPPGAGLLAGGVRVPGRPAPDGRRLHRAGREGGHYSDRQQASEGVGDHAGGALRGTGVGTIKVEDN